MKVSLGAVLLVAVALGASACGSGHSTGKLPTSGPNVSSSRLVKDGHIQITATVPTRARIGKPLSVTFRITNTSKQPRKLQLGYQELWFVVHAAKHMHYDTRVAYGVGTGGGPVPLTRLKPGQSVTSRTGPILVRWSGPLRITPGWNEFALPSLNVPLTTPAGRVPSDRAAIADVVAKTGHLLDNCHPVRPGVSVIGRIDAPKNSAPPLRANCSISLRREHGFDVAQVLILTPPDLRGIRVSEPYERLPWFKGPEGKVGGVWGTNAEAIGWEFIVTHEGAMSVDSTSVESARSGSGRWVPEWRSTTSGWTNGEGSARCGYTGGVPGGYGGGPNIEFVSVCS